MSDTPETIAYCHSCGAPMDVSAVAPFSNVECPKCGKHTRVKREFGPYTLVRRHAVGGMSMVFAAHDNTLDREVALKILSEEFSADERRIAAFEEEARITASFSHPNVVRVLTTGRAFGRFYIAMELVPGGHFEHQIRERGCIPEADLLPLAIEVAHGLKAAHAAGLIHRDVKPGNILLDAEGHAKLVDFGLALVTQGGKARAKELWATPYYVPPETVEGHAEDFRSDIYAFGATLYHALAGVPSCNEESMATDVLREAKKRVVPLATAAPAISADTCRIVDRAMAYDPNQRFHSYDELIQNLSVALGHLRSGHVESPQSAAKRRAGKKRRERNLLVTGGAVMLAVTTGAIIWLGRDKPQPSVKPPAPTGDIAPPPAVDDSSAEIARSYREARAAVESRDYAKAAQAFDTLHTNPSVQEPTRTWAGVEAVLTYFLDGKVAEARKQSRETLNHMGALPAGVNPEAQALTSTLQKLGGFPPLAPPPAAAGADASRVINAMLAGLKNWEQGLTEPAAACFRYVVESELPQDARWAAVYQKLAADYLADHQTLTGPLFQKPPADKAGCESAIDELNAVLATLKTRGRARFNVRAWQLDLTRMSRLMDDPRPARPPDPSPAVTPADVIAKVAEFSRDYRFAEAATYLKSLPANPADATRASLLAMAESSTVFLADIEDDLSKEPAILDLPLRTGESIGKLAIGPNGNLSATDAAGQPKALRWSDFTPDALIALHRLLVRNPDSELERLRRHECAIAYDWLAGNRERALNAASTLAESSPAFRQRWEAIAASLPK